VEEGYWMAFLQSEYHYAKTLSSKYAALHSQLQQ